MDLAYLKKLVRLVENSGVDTIEVEEEGIKIRISKHPHNSSVGMYPAHVAAVTTAQPGHPVPAVAEERAAPSKPEITYHEVKSPIVGTFYRSPAPDADPYVEVGAVVQQGTVLCIIEAMKLMNEIESDAAGRIVKILVENGQPVEYNQTLFLLEPV